MHLEIWIIRDMIFMICEWLLEPYTEHGDEGMDGEWLDL